MWVYRCQYAALINHLSMKSLLNCANFPLSFYPYYTHYTFISVAFLSRVFVFKQRGFIGMKDALEC